MKSFNLDEAIQTWRRNLNKYPGFEEGTSEELESFVRDSVADLVAGGMPEEEAFKKVTQDKIGDLEMLSNEYYKAKSVSSKAKPARGTTLAGNFLKVALRNISKSKPHSYINIAGLVIGFTSIILIANYLVAEFSFDKFHNDHQKIYRVVNRVQRGETQLNFPMSPPALAPSLLTDFPEIVEVTRIRYSDTQLLQYQDATYYENSVFYADSSFFKIFDFELISGNPLTALNHPNAIVITEKIAQKYFGTADALNKTLILEGDRTLTVTGVLKNIPRNSHIDFDMLISFQTFRVSAGNLAGLTSWVWMSFMTYIKTHEGVDINRLEEKIKNHYLSHEPRFSEMKLAIDLQKLSDVYLGSTDLENNSQLFRVNSYTTLYSLLAVGLLIILIASFNYINLSIAISMKRFKEIAVRRVLGSTKGKLIFQFMMESVIYAMLALALAVCVAYLLQTLLPSSLSSKLNFTTQSLGLFSLAMIAFALLVGVVSGIFPALRLASVHALELLKGNFKLQGGVFRNLLTGFQFTLSAVLIAVSLIIARQIDFFSKKDLGFTDKGIVSINIGSDQFNGKARTLQKLLESQPGVQSVAQSNHIIGEGTAASPLYLKGQTPDDAIQMNYYQTDYNFQKTLGLQLVQGRYFSEAFKNDSTGSIVLNETAVKALGLTDPIGQRVIFTGGIEKEIIGVVKDFHYGSLHQEIASLAMIMPFTYVENLIVHIDGDMIRTLGAMENAWKKAYPGLPFEFRFQDSHLQTLYEKDKLFSTLIRFFSILAMLIACLGMYSLAALALASNLKQISIRRVLGAPAKDIMLLVGKSFFVLVLIATVLSWPLVWYAMNQWLSNFAYHIELNISFLVITLITVITITVVTISYHLFKASTVNPAEILRDN